MIRSARSLSSPTTSLDLSITQRKRRILVHHQQKVRLDAQPPSKRPYAKLVESSRVGARQQNAEPRRDRRERPRDEHEEQHEDVREREQQTEAHRKPIAGALGIDDLDRRRIRPRRSRPRGSHAESRESIETPWSTGSGSSAPARARPRRDTAWRHYRVNVSAGKRCGGSRRSRG